ncbi:cupredoxin domain-containing protein [Saccharopolyspora elongata]|uniref:hypothetical protein n=1 Tax=Saccharopolyspora elongata TaxID=2530387 RepID=UPI001F29A447|nr:hypothetical protein [Saccharopolyspora elongata]
MGANRVISRKTGRTRGVLLSVLLGVLALVATVCTSASAAAAPPAPAGPGGGGSHLVIVKMVDYKLLQPAFLQPGRYTFRAINEGRMPHALEISGPGVANASTPVVQSGQAADLTVDLRRGLYDFWCPVGNHRQMGMQLDVYVG